MFVFVIICFAASSIAYFVSHDTATSRRFEFVVVGLAGFFLTLLAGFLGVCSWVLESPLLRALLQSVGHAWLPEKLPGLVHIGDGELFGWSRGC